MLKERGYLLFTVLILMGLVALMSMSLQRIAMVNMAGSTVLYQKIRNNSSIKKTPYYAGVGGAGSSLAQIGDQVARRRGVPDGTCHST